jgi:hypothetical protein
LKKRWKDRLRAFCGGDACAAAACCKRWISQAKDIRAEGQQICLEVIDKLKALPGVQGIHFMAIGNIPDLKRLIVESGL